METKKTVGNKISITQTEQIKEKSEFEKSEDIEILRFFDLNIPILMVETKKGNISVDIPEDVVKVEAEIKKLRDK